jgi:hypothetical protein
MAEISVHSKWALKYVIYPVSGLPDCPFSPNKENDQFFIYGSKTALARAPSTIVSWIKMISDLCLYMIFLRAIFLQEPPTSLSLKERTIMREPF